MDHDSERVSFTRLHPVEGKNDLTKDSSDFFDNVSKVEAKNQFREFIRNFRLDDEGYVYRVQLLQRYRKRERFLTVNIGHIQQFNPTLLIALQMAPNLYIDLFEKAAIDALSQLVIQTDESGDPLDEPNDEITRKTIQICLTSDQIPTGIRSIEADHMTRLLKVPGIVTSSSRVRVKITAVKMMCGKCMNVKVVECVGPFSSFSMPTTCDQGRGDKDERVGPVNDCGPNSFVVLAEECVFIDQQTLKLQENPEVVPTGEMPRSILVSVDRNLVDLASPGTRISVMGICSMFSSRNSKKEANNFSVKTPFLLGLGLDISSEGSGRANSFFSPAEEEQFLELSRRKNIYMDMVASIAPSISGDYTVDIKKAIACQLFGGSRKVLPDGTRLRGDINVLLLGDPSTAKSQFLKFVERVAPVGIYTSGKGSSAAGLTASVIKDNRGEFYLEGGALVLADGGIVCIDEFDKMREIDRVAIHEAMEQQTISIAKAGITTILNSRTSVLAAANPIFGRYNDLKSAAENIDLMTTILSRFDLIFVVRDIRDLERDKSIARHVVDVHMSASSMSKFSASKEHSGGIDMRLMKKYINYCRVKCSPRLTQEAEDTLGSQYVTIREEMRKVSMRDKTQQVVPITVRQLEALIRLSESLAKMRLSSKVLKQDVEEALRLFQVSTVAAASTDNYANSMAGLDPEKREMLMKAEAFVLQQIPKDKRKGKKYVLEEGEKMGFSSQIMTRAMVTLVARGNLVEKTNGFFLCRKK